MSTSTAQTKLEWTLFEEDAEPKALPFSLLEEITNGFSDNLEIGRGGFAVVYMGMLDHGDVVAVKRLIITYPIDKEFQREVGCLMKIQHKNVVRFLGYCASTKGLMVMYNGKLVMAEMQERLLCFEYLPKGNLEHYIKDSSVGLEWREWYKIIKGICEGLNYLHQNNILHLDLKPANILLDKDMMPKIIDFGQSRCLEERQTHVFATIVAGTKGYLAPEYTSNKITSKFDLYSLGVIIIEILTGKKGRQVVENSLESWRNRSDISQWKQIQVCADIGLECIDFNPANRPLSMKHIIDRLLETESEQVIPAGGPSELLVLRRFALCFIFEPKKVFTCPLELTNSTNRHVAFRLRDKGGDSFLRLPLHGLVLPRSLCTLSVSTQEYKELPQKSNMDLILESATILVDDYINTFQSQPDIYFGKAKKTGNVVQEVTLKAFYTPRRETKDSSKCMLFEEGTEPALPFSLLEEITNGFSNKLEIGRGGSAVVYMGMLDNGHAVAVKKFSALYSDKEFQTEVECLMRVKHKNVVQFLGYCADTKGSMHVYNGNLIMADTRERLICFEYLPKGSLEHYIKGSSGSLEWSKEYEIIKGICEGLNYLHQKNILHLDLKPANILLNEVMVPKIIDFGHSRCLEEKQTHIISTKTVGTIGYMAPEVLDYYDKRITYKSDMFSLGVIILEILTTKWSYDVENVLESCRNMSDRSLRRQIQVCMEIGMECTRDDPWTRPISMKHILNRLLETESTQIIPASGQSMGNVMPMKAFYTPRGEMVDSSKTSQCDGDKGEEIDDNSAHSFNKTRNHVKKAAEEWMAKHPLVGRRSEMNDLRQCTTNALFSSIQVMSVWGIAGVGKSALLKNLLCDRILSDCSLLERNRHSLFDKYGWVDVSYPFDLRNFSWSLLLSFHSQSLQANKDHDTDKMGSENPIAECRAIMKNQRCLIIIDDLRSTKEWDMIHAELVSGSSKNCIISITTEESIAKRCRGSKGELVFNVKCLRADAAFDLFKNEVSRKYPLPHTLPHGDVAELQELISKCGGLPKVIVEIAGLLANKSVGWMEGARSINDNFMQDWENNREFDSLQGLFFWMRTYFSTCPDSLKPCIFYLSIFPRDRIIRRRRLVRRWVAEGYSRDSHEESAEENGENHFSSLLDLSIIQQPPNIIATTKQRDTRIISCQVNGFIREYIVSRRMEENLVFELGGLSTLTTQPKEHHLVILQSWDRDIGVFESINFSRLQSLTVFGDWRSFFISESMKLLRVLDLEDASGSVKDKDLERMVRWLGCLKFLSLRGRHEIRHLPIKLGHLRQLQTLDVRGTSVVSLPKSITKLQKLQYIRAGTIDVQAPTSPASPIWLPKFCRCRRIIGVQVPKGIGKLTALHTLGVVDVAASGGRTMLKELKQLTQLRKLGVSGINKNNSSRLFSAISGHVHLESLSVRLDNQGWFFRKDNNKGCFFKKDDTNQGCCSKKDTDQSCLSTMISLPCENLRSLKLYGLEDRLPGWRIDRLPKLQKLDLEMATLPATDVGYLGQLPQLCILRIKQLRDGELQFRVLGNNEEDNSFQKVEVLQIACGNSSSRLRVTFGKQTMKILELLVIDCCRGSPSYQFSGLENLRELKQVFLLNASNADTLKKDLGQLLLELRTDSKNPAVRLVWTD